MLSIQLGAGDPKNRFSWQTWTKVNEGYYVSTVKSLSNTGANMPTSGTGNTGNITSNGTSLTVAQMPAHTHNYYINQGSETVTNTISFSGSGHLVRNTNATNGLAVVTSSTGSGTAHSHTITMPKLQLVCWIRTA